MAHWLLKTEPEEFSWDDQVKRGAKGEPWTGVRNFIARGNLKAMKKGEHAFFYHTGKEKQIVGIVGDHPRGLQGPDRREGRVLCGRYPGGAAVPRPVTLAAVKADAKLKTMMLAREPRLSVQPVTDEEWKPICQMGGVDEVRAALAGEPEGRGRARCHRRDAASSRSSG